jgi:hypothetical protein
VDWYSGVFELAFPDIDRAQANRSRVPSASAKEEEEDD